MEKPFIHWAKIAVLVILFGLTVVSFVAQRSEQGRQNLSALSSVFS